MFEVATVKFKNIRDLLHHVYYVRKGEALALDDLLVVNRR